MMQNTSAHKEGTQGIYEIAFISILETAGDAVEGVVRTQGGEMTARRLTTPTQFAYPIQTHSAGYFGAVQFRVDAGAISALKKALDGEKNILRFLLVKNPVVQKGESTVSLRRDREGGDSRESGETSPKETRPEVLTNEALEAKLEEILK